MNGVTGFEIVLAAALIDAGYDCEIINTGGGCTAWEVTHRDTPDWCVLITNGDLSHAVTAYSCAVTSFQRDLEDAYIECPDPVTIGEVVAAVDAAHRRAKESVA